MSKPRILIIDDDQALIKGMKKILKNDGYTITVAENGEEALEKMRENTPDLIFLDLRMPVMDGFAFLNAIDIQADDPYLVVVMTGHGEDKDVEKCFKLGVNFFLRKPLSMIEVQGLTRRCLDLKRIERELREHRDHLEEKVAERTRQIEEQLNFRQHLIDCIPTPVYFKDAKRVFIGCNRAFERTMGYPRTEIIGKTIKDIAPARVARRENQTDNKILMKKRGGSLSYEGSYVYDDGSYRDLLIFKASFKDSSGRVAGIIATSVDITERKQAQMEMETRSEELEGANTSLRLLLKQVTESRDEMEDRIMHNINELIYPYLDQLENTLPGQAQESTWVEVIRENLEKITSGFTQDLSSRYLALSPREIQVANLIRLGKTNKETARILKISRNAVEFHRNNLRKKLGIKQKKVNLRTYLLSMH